MKLQRGLTLIEMVIAISLLAIMISAIVFSFDGSKSRAQVLIAAMEEYTGAMERIKTDTSCYPKSLAALLDRSLAEGTAKSFCGADLSKQWNGPYVKSAPTKPAPYGGGGPAIFMSQLSPDLTLRVARQTSAFSGAGASATWKWFIVADGVPREILTQALTVCNGDAGIGAAATGTAATAFTGTRKCAKNGDDVSTVGYDTKDLDLAVAAEGTPGSFGLLFAETRQ